MRTDVRGMCVLTTRIAKPLSVPSSRGGDYATSRKYCRRHPLIGADGVVRNISDHPVASKVASQLFLIAQPPLLQRRRLGIRSHWQTQLLCNYSSDDVTFNVGKTEVSAGELI